MHTNKLYKISSNANDLVYSRSQELPQEVQFGVNQHYLFKNTIATLLFISKRGANSILVHNPTPIYFCLVNRHHWLQARTCALVCWAPPALPQVTNTVRKALKIYTACYAILANFVPPTNAWVFLMSCMCKDIRRGSIAGGNGVRDQNLYTRVMSTVSAPLGFVGMTSLLWHPNLILLKAKAVAGWVTTFDRIKMIWPTRQKTSRWFCPSVDDDDSWILSNSDCLLWVQYLSVLAVFFSCFIPIRIKIYILKSCIDIN